MKVYELNSGCVEFMCGGLGLRPARTAMSKWCTVRTVMASSEWRNYRTQGERCAHTEQNIELVRGSLNTPPVAQVVLPAQKTLVNT